MRYVKFTDRFSAEDTSSDLLPPASETCENQEKPEASSSSSNSSRCSAPIKQKYANSHNSNNSNNLSLLEAGSDQIDAGGPAIAATVATEHEILAQYRALLANPLVTDGDDLPPIPPPCFRKHQDRDAAWSAWWDAVEAVWRRSDGLGMNGMKKRQE